MEQITPATVVARTVRPEATYHVAELTAVMASKMPGKEGQFNKGIVKSAELGSGPKGTEVARDPRFCTDNLEKGKFVVIEKTLTPVSVPLEYKKDDKGEFVLDTKGRKQVTSWGNSETEFKQAFFIVGQYATRKEALTNLRGGELNDMSNEVVNKSIDEEFAALFAGGKPVTVSAVAGVNA